MIELFSILQKQMMLWPGCDLHHRNNANVKGGATNCTKPHWASGPWYLEWIDYFPIREINHSICKFTEQNQKVSKNSGSDGSRENTANTIAALYYQICVNVYLFFIVFHSLLMWTVVVLLFLALRFLCAVSPRHMSAKQSWNFKLKKKEKKETETETESGNYPELYDIQERVVVACCGCQHFRLLSLYAGQILLQ